MLHQQFRELRAFAFFFVLEVTNTSRQWAVSRAIVSAQRAMPSGVYPSSRNRKYA